MPFGGTGIWILRHNAHRTAFAIKVVFEWFGIDMPSKGACKQVITCIENATVSNKMHTKSHHTQQSLRLRINKFLNLLCLTVLPPQTIIPAWLGLWIRVEQLASRYLLSELPFSAFIYIRWRRLRQALRMNSGI
jgi:hypothetical protein